MGDGVSLASPLLRAIALLQAVAISSAYAGDRFPAFVNATPRQPVLRGNSLPRPASAGGPPSRCCLFSQWGDGNPGEMCAVHGLIEPIVPPRESPGRSTDLVTGARPIDEACPGFQSQAACLDEKHACEWSGTKCTSLQPSGSLAHAAQAGEHIVTPLRAAEIQRSGGMAMDTAGNSLEASCLAMRPDGKTPLYFVWDDRHETLERFVMDRTTEESRALGQEVCWDSARGAGAELHCVRCDPRYGVFALHTAACETAVAKFMEARGAPKYTISEEFGPDHPGKHVYEHTVVYEE
jgi:hypothetical protein